MPGKRPKLPNPPDHSLDPADWFMYCDLLQDAGAGKTTWRRAQKIAESLRQSTDLLLVVCSGSMARWKPFAVRLPRTNDVGSILAWLKPSWDTARQLIAAYGSPERCLITTPFAETDSGLYIRFRTNGGEGKKAFFNAHSLQKDPSVYTSITF